jgi:hypothetical protein
MERQYKGGRHFSQAALSVYRAEHDQSAASSATEDDHDRNLVIPAEAGIHQESCDNKLISYALRPLHHFCHPLERGNPQ